MGWTITDLPTRLLRQRHQPRHRAPVEALSRRCGPRVSSLSGNLQRFGIEGVAKVESLQEIIADMTDTAATSNKTSSACPCSK